MKENFMFGVEKGQVRRATFDIYISHLNLTIWKLKANGSTHEKVKND